MKQNRSEFVELLYSTGREGMDEVIGQLEELGFFQAPASSKFHLNHEGGLLEHSLNVCKVGLMLREQMLALKTRPGRKPEQGKCHHRRPAA